MKLDAPSSSRSAFSGKYLWRGTNLEKGYDTDWLLTIVAEGSLIRLFGLESQVLTSHMEQFSPERYIP